jgi:hypothetical protein
MNSFEPALNCIELAGILGARQTSTTVRLASQSIF